ncbi:MAG: type IV secretory system conjugative DNA transfer family protein [Gemmataceae bacterium]
MNPSANDQVVCLLAFAAIVVVCLYRHRWKGSGTAFGTASWMSDKALRAWGFLSGHGLILGRTFEGALIRLPQYCHILLCGGTGSGKGVSVIIPNLLSYFHGSVVVFDTKGDLFETTARRRAAKGERIIRLAPFNGGTDAFNALATIPHDSPGLVDSARAMAEALVVRQGTEADPHWNDKSVQVICAVLVLVLLRFKGEDRNLSSVQEIISDPELLKATVKMLQQVGGVPARLGNQLKTLFERDGSGLTKEGAGVLSTVTRHLSFLDSDLVAKAVGSSTFDPADLRKPGITLFLQIPPDQLDAQKGLLRCLVSTLVRVIGSVGSEWDGETLFLLDEASALGSLPAIEEAMVRGRSAGVRLLLAYQSDSQIRAAFKDKPTLLYDNCSTQIYLGAASSYETAERLSKSIGEWTQVVESYSENQSYSSQSGGNSQGGGQNSRGTTLSYSVTGRALLRPEEILTLDNDCLLVLNRGMSPILAQRLKWYQDPMFNPVQTQTTKQRYAWLWTPPSLKVQLIVAGVMCLIVVALLNRVNH